MAKPVTTDGQSDKGDSGGDIQYQNTTYRRIPSFKLLDSDHASSKRLRNKVPSSMRCASGSSGALWVDDVTTLDKVEPRRTPLNFSPAWHANANNLFGFGPESIDTDGDDVQRLDDATLDDLAFFGMSGADGSTLPQSEEREANIKQYQLVPDDNKRPTQGNHDGNGIGGGQDRDASGADTPVDPLRRCMLDENAFDPDGRLPSFSVPIEALINKQLEAAELTINERARGERSMDSITSQTLAARGANALSFALNPPSFGTAGQGKELSLYHEDQELQQVSFLDLPSSDLDRGKDISLSSDNQEETLASGILKLSKDDREKGESTQCEDARVPKSNRRKKGLVRRPSKNRGKRPKSANHMADEIKGGRTMGFSGSGGGVAKRQTSEDVAARLPLEVLECFYHVPLNVAAQELNVSLTMLKKLCRAYGVKRWPHRQVSSLDKTIARLQDKIAARGDDGKDAPTLTRKLEQGMKRRSVIIKTASAGLDADVLNTIFTSRPGEMDEDMLLESSNVAEAVGKIKMRRSRQEIDVETENNEDYDEDVEGSNDGQDGHLHSPVGTRALTCEISSPGREDAKASIRSCPISSAAKFARSSPPPTFKMGCSTKSMVKPETSLDPQPARRNKRGTGPFKGRRGVTTSSSSSTGIIRTTRSAAAAAAAAAAGAAFSATTPLAGSAAPATRTNETSSVAPAAQNSGESANGSLSTKIMNSPHLGVSSVSSSSARECFPRKVAPMAGFSGVFGTGVRPSSATSGGGYCGGGFGSKYIAGAIGGTAAHAQTAHMSPWSGVTCDGAPRLGNWQPPQYPLVSPIRRLADGSPESRTTMTPIESLSDNFQLESPPALPTPASPSQSHQAYLQQQHPYPYGCQPIAWLPGQFPSPQHFPYGGPVEAASAVDTRYMSAQRRHAFGALSSTTLEHEPPTTAGSRVGVVAKDSGGGAGSEKDGDNSPTASGVGNNVNDNGGTGGEDSVKNGARSGLMPTSGGNIAKASSSRTPTGPPSSDIPARRTGFMSYLLHQLPNTTPVTRTAFG